MEDCKPQPAEDETRELSLAQFLQQMMWEFDETGYEDVQETETSN